MKSLKILFACSCLLGMMWSCTDLEERPVGILAPEAIFRTANDVEVAVLGSVGLLATEQLYGRQFTTALMLRSDMVDIGDRGTVAARIQMNDFNMDDNNAMVLVIWPRFYEVISAANAALAGSEIVTGSEARINALAAEARFMRAFSYFHLVRNFGEIPYIDFFVSDPATVKNISKTSVATIYQNIIQDLEFAKQWLPDRHPNNVRTRATKGTAAAYLANVHLTLENWQRAYEEAKWVIDNKDRFGYQLMEDFQDLYKAHLADGLAEHIFAVDFLGLQTAPGNINVDFLTSHTGVRGADRSGWSVNVPSLKVYQTWPEGDYRKRVSFDSAIMMGGRLQPYQNFVNTQRPHIAKYTRFPGNAQGEFQQSDHNYPDMRYADVLLMAAEALGEISGATAEAVGYINQVRERARNEAGVMNPLPADISPGISKDEFIRLVLEERRFELAFEYKRWYDIQRRRMGNEVFLGSNSLEPRSNFSEARDYLWPIPRQELENNPNLLPQNPGY